MGKYCVIHISETRGAIDTKFAGYIHPVQDVLKTAEAFLVATSQLIGWFSKKRCSTALVGVVVVSW